MKYLLQLFLAMSCLTMGLAWGAESVPLKHKIAQMVMIGFNGKSLQDNDQISNIILSDQIGGVILFDYDFKTKVFDRNIESPEQLSQLTKALQARASDAARYAGRENTPLFIAVDYEGGTVNRLKEGYGFPETKSPAELGMGSIAQAQFYAKRMANTLKQAGININMAPVVDVNVNPENPIIGKRERSFSSDPTQVVQYAAIFSKAYAEQGILCAYKHFPGHGSSLSDTHLGFVDVTQTWQPIELEPYQQLLQSPDACTLVMTAHVVHYGLDNEGYPASLSYAITQKLLREQLHFKGLVITDDLQMGAVKDQYGLAESVVHAVNAGADILVFGNQMGDKFQEPQEVIEIIYQNIQSGKISEARIEESYQRIMRAKHNLIEYDHS